MTIEELLTDYIVLAGCRDYLAAWDTENHYAIFYQWAADQWDMVRLYRTEYAPQTGQQAKNIAAVCIMRYLSDVDKSYSDGANAELLITL